jgi:hypothetical protein
MFAHEFEMEAILAFGTRQDSLGMKNGGVHECGRLFVIQRNVVLARKVQRLVPA